MKVFLDTNVVIDFCAQREPFFPSAATIIDMVYHREIDIIISSLTFINVAYILRKAFPRDEVNKKLSNLASLSNISPINESTITNAIRSHTNDFEDYVQYLSAVISGADIIVTRDKKGFEGSSIALMTPDEFVKRCR